MHVGGLAQTFKVALILRQCGKQRGTSAFCPHGRHHNFGPAGRYIHDRFSRALAATGGRGLYPDARRMRRVVQCQRLSRRSVLQSGRLLRTRLCWLDLVGLARRLWRLARGLPRQPMGRRRPWRGGPWWRRWSPLNSDGCPFWLSQAPRSSGLMIAGIRSRQAQGHQVGRHRHHDESRRRVASRAYDQPPEHGGAERPPSRGVRVCWIVFFPTSSPTLKVFTATSPRRA